jgi:FkbM family methyltransferase
MFWVNSLVAVLSHPTNKSHQLKTIMRVVWWKLNQLFFHLPTLVEISPGVKCICYPDSSFGSLIVYVTLPEFLEMHFVLAVIEPKDTFIDVGANIGVFSLLAASKINQGKVYAFEPLALPLQRLQENSFLNNFHSSIIPFNFVISEHNGMINFEEHPASEESAISLQEHSSSSKIQKYKTITLDNFIKQKSLKAIKLLKIDVEGAELSVLKGATKALENQRVQMILVELNPQSQQYGYTQTQTLEFLQKHQFKCFLLDPKEGLSPINASTLSSTTINIVAIHKKVKTSPLIKKYLQELSNEN